MDKLSEYVAINRTVSVEVTGQFHIKRIGAKLYVLIPHNGSVRSDANLFKASPLIPRLEYTTADQVRKVDLSLGAVRITKPYPMSLSRFYVNRPDHLATTYIPAFV